MKITGVETLVCHARMRNWVFVKVLTDQPGLFGWGEATLEWHTRAWSAPWRIWLTLIVGEDPPRIEHLWQMMYRQHFWHGNGIVRGTAIAGIDIALWDILPAKFTACRVSQLWGGPVRDEIRTYCHLGGGKLEDFYETQCRGIATLCRAGPAGGRRRIHGIQGDGRPAHDAARRICRPIHAAEACVAAMRDAVGDEIDIMVDCHARPSPAMGMRFAKALEPYGLYFLEEPCWPESISTGLAAINRTASPRRSPRANA